MVLVCASVFDIICNYRPCAKPVCETILCIYVYRIFAFIYVRMRGGNFPKRVF